MPDYTAHHFVATHHRDPARALHRAPADAALKLLLAHQPRTAPAAAEAGFDLQLSGHTPGGPFFPWPFVVPLQPPYTAGLPRPGQPVQKVIHPSRTLSGHHKTARFRKRLGA